MFIRLTITALLLVSFTLLVNSCISVPELPTAREDDAGDYAFVRHLVPKLLGRKPRNRNEVKVMGDIAEQVGRATLFRATVKHVQYRAEYIDYWSETLIANLRVHRQGSGKTMTGNCFGPPDRGPDVGALANWVKRNPANRQAASSFNLTDLLRSSVVIDDLSPIYRGYLFALVTHPQHGNMATEQNRRDDIGQAFTHSYTGHNQACLNCHNTSQSTTDAGSGWNRHFPIPGQIERALYTDRDSAGIPYNYHQGRDPNQVNALFRTTSGSTLNDSDQLSPWGWATGCSPVKLRRPGTYPVDPLVNADGIRLEAFFGGNLGGRASVWELEEKLRLGIRELGSGIERDYSPDVASTCEMCRDSCTDGVGREEPVLDADAMAREAAGRVVLDNHCSDCHTTDSLIDAPGNVIYGTDAAMSDIIVRVGLPDSNSSRMPRLPRPRLTIPEIQTLLDWMEQYPTATDCSVCSITPCNPDYIASSNEAFAYVVAQNAVSDIWENIFGEPLTIHTYFPRTKSQRDTLWHLTEQVFIRENWSLKKVLEKIFLSEFFNRQTVATTSAHQAYELPAQFEPWALGDPREPPLTDAGYDPDLGENRERHFNSIGDTVHRYRPYDLFNSVHTALGWPNVQRRSSTTPYPSDNLRKAVGQFYSGAEPGADELDFAGLLAWTDTYASCSNRSADDDWIDLVVSQAASLTESGSVVTIGDLAIAIKDRLLSNAELSTRHIDGVGMSEVDVIEAIFSAGVDTPIASPARPALKQSARRLCATLLSTPQYLLAGVVPAGISDPLNIEVCLPGKPCTYQQICERYRTPLRRLGYDINCMGDTLVAEPWDPAADLENICPPGQCGHVGGGGSDEDPSCADFPLLCGGFPEPPPCDPRCAVIDCCGGPLPPLDFDGRLVAWAEGAKILEANGIRVLRYQADTFKKLEVGDVLNYGDLLQIPTNSQFAMKAGEQLFHTPKAKPWGEAIPNKVLWMQITGPAALAAKPEVSWLPGHHARSLRNGIEGFPARYGTGGTPVFGNQKMEYDPKRSSMLNCQTKPPPRPWTEEQIEATIKKNKARKPRRTPDAVEKETD